MSVGPTPQSQLDALPLITAAQAATAGTLQIVGGTVFRRFTPAQLGINAAAMAVVNGCALIAGNWLDLRGTTKYMVAIRCVNALVTVARPALVLQWQFRMGPTDTPSPSIQVGGSYNPEFNSIVFAGNTIVFPAAAAGQVLTKCINWDSATIPAQGNNQGTAIFGTDVRPIISSQSSNPIAADNVFSMYLVGSN